VTTGRRQARRTALFLLYQWDVTGTPLASLYEGEVDAWAREVAEGVAAQAEALDATLTELERELTIVLEFQLPEEQAYERLIGRGRSDDNPETIRHRLDAQRVPDDVVAYYRAKGILVGVHADGSVDEVFAEVQSVLETAAAR